MPNTLSPRPSLDQVLELLNIMEKHPNFALGKMRGSDVRTETNNIWIDITKTLNSISGPTKTLKCWAKYWADKKFQVKSKVQSAGGDTSVLVSNVEMRIWDLCFAQGFKKTRKKHIKKTIKSSEKNDIFDNDIDNNADQSLGDFEEQNVGDFEEQNVDDFEEKHASVLDDRQSEDFEEKQLCLMEKVVQAMGNQATALSQLAHAASLNAQAMERLAQASQVQAHAVERLANSFDSISSSSQDMRNAIVDIDATMKRFYSAPT